MVTMSQQGSSSANSSTAESAVNPRRIVVITTGGTIACTTDRNGALTPSISGTELVATVAQRYPEGMMDLEVRELGTLESSTLQLDDVDRIIAAIHEALDDDSVDGVVVTHGTDTMEETAMAADVFHADSRPVVFTGAQLPYDHPETDGPGNLFEAITIASDASAQGIGVLIVFGHAVLPVRGATKWHTTDPLAFATNAPEEPLRPEPLPVKALAGSKVEIIPAYLGADGSLLDAAVAAGARGIVVEGLGAGNVSESFAAAIDRAIAADVPVVMATRVPRGDVHASYGGAGGGATLARHGVISAGCVHAPQARIILAAALAADVHPQTLF
ncbi:MAG: asparaginase [Corynebacterium sp.]|uniref:asparaginase n=1 Tax=Corynebacterium sp. TaxID=1720 RepID=UPI0026DCDB89|nr:asparaginase [Corynebacterium sp.]MDO5029630.1 asparaginase [Corynebacterium sp.]